MLDSTLRRSIPSGGEVAFAARTFVNRHQPLGKRIVAPGCFSLVAHGLEVARDFVDHRLVAQHRAWGVGAQDAIGDEAAVLFGRRERHDVSAAQLETVSPVRFVDAHSVAQDPAIVNAERNRFVPPLLTRYEHCFSVAQLVGESFRPSGEQMELGATPSNVHPHLDARNSPPRRIGPESVPAFQLLGDLTHDERPTVWVLERLLSGLRQPAPRSRAVHQVVGETFHKHPIARLVPVRLEELRQPFDVDFTQRHVSERLGDVPLEGVGVRLSEAASVANFQPLIEFRPQLEECFSFEAFGVRSSKAAAEHLREAGIERQRRMVFVGVHVKGREHRQCEEAGRERDLLGIGRHQGTELCRASQNR